MSRARLVRLIPLAGALHARWPAFNAVHVRDAVARCDPDVVCVPLARGALDDDSWQATEEIALPLTVVPWAERAGVPIVTIGIGEDDPEDPGDVGAERDLIAFMEMYDAGRERLAALTAAAGPLRELLAGPLDVGRLLAEVVPAVAAYQQERERLLSAGPGTGWLEQRGSLLASRVLAAGGERVAALVPLDYYPAVKAALEGRAEVEEIDADGQREPTPEARARSLMDLAFSGGGAEPTQLLAGLEEIDDPEARFHEANLLLALGHVSRARAKLQALVAGDFSRPYYLPGFALTRLGQLHDLEGDRDAALRCYRGALALSFAPAAATEMAAAGLERPFAAAGR